MLGWIGEIKKRGSQVTAKCNNVFCWFNVVVQEV